MTDGTRQPDEYDPFVLYAAYPEAAPIFRWRPTLLEDIKNECIVVLDTNILATPYTKISSKSLIEIGNHVPDNPPAPEPLWPVVKAGPIRLGWSIGGDGSGYVYLGPPWNSDDCEIALTDKSDVTNVDVSRLKFFGFHRG